MAPPKRSTRKQKLRSGNKNEAGFTRASNTHAVEPKQGDKTRVIKNGLTLSADHKTKEREEKPYRLVDGLRWKRETTLPAPTPLDS
ncbi:hypothetical protein NDU88_012179 [Pleurodeles waltl]|uniref:Uncharacterized protein n=1 Tax=Pleurodeles waltl TaxID=8319 RepID=A0AAV7QZE0_PLEWA|nr:hypothetical protein NDU88_012179 [Pleurodeles waltl]